MARHVPVRLQSEADEMTPLDERDCCIAAHTRASRLNCNENVMISRYITRSPQTEGRCRISLGMVA